MGLTKGAERRLNFEFTTRHQAPINAQTPEK